MTGQEKLTYLDFCEAGSYMDFLLPVLPQTGIAVKTLRTEDLAAEELGEQLRMGDRREQLRLIACGETTLTGDPEENERKLMYLGAFCLSISTSRVTKAVYQDNSVRVKDRSHGGKGRGGIPYL